MLMETPGQKEFIHRIKKALGHAPERPTAKSRSIRSSKVRRRPGAVLQVHSKIEHVEEKENLFDMLDEGCQTD